MINPIEILIFIIGSSFGAVIVYLLLSKKIKQYKQLSLTDQLTGLHNDRAFNGRFEFEINRCKRYHLPLSILLIDVDNFKTINSNFGYKIGDKVLQEITNRIKPELRNTDLFFRYKLGDELIIMALNTNKRGANELSIRIKNKINYSFFSIDNKNKKVTISIGVSEFDLSNPKKDIEKEAEKNLKEDKKNKNE